MQLIDDEFIVQTILECNIGYGTERGKTAFSLYPSVMRITDKRIVFETRNQRSDNEKKAQELILKAIAHLLKMPGFVSRQYISTLMFNPNENLFAIPLETIDVKKTIANNEGLLSIIVNDTYLPVRMNPYSAVEAQYTIERRALMLEKRFSGNMPESYYWDKEEDDK